MLLAVLRQSLLACFSNSPQSCLVEIWQKTPIPQSEEKSIGTVLKIRIAMLSVYDSFQANSICVTEGVWKTFKHYISNVLIGKNDKPL